MTDPPPTEPPAPPAPLSSPIVLCEEGVQGERSCKKVKNSHDPVSEPMVLEKLAPKNSGCEDLIPSQADMDLSEGGIVDNSTNSTQANQMMENKGIDSEENVSKDKPNNMGLSYRDVVYSKELKEVWFDENIETQISKIVQNGEQGS